MNIVVCDDEALARERLVRIVKQAGHNVVAQVETGIQALEAVINHQPDLILLDIQMPGMNGIDCATELNKLEYPPAIVFVTAFDSYAITAFNANAVGYLLKPAKKEDLLAALDKAGHLNAAQLRELGKLNDSEMSKANRLHVSARSHKGIELVPLSDIYYFIADQKYVKVRHKEGMLLIDDTLKEVEQEFGDELFRIHRNALINLEYLELLKTIEAGQYQVCFKDIDDTLAVSRRHVPTLREKIKQM